jgi:hypothetical protein
MVTKYVFVLSSVKLWQNVFKKGSEGETCSLS